MGRTGRRQLSRITERRGEKGRRDGFLSCRRSFGRLYPRDGGRRHDRRCAVARLTLNKLEAMTAVCSVGLDMIAVPGDTPAEVIAAIIADEAAIGMVNRKTTAVRLIPAIGKKVGEELSFGGLLGGGPVMDINRYSPARLIGRGDGFRPYA